MPSIKLQEKGNLFIGRFIYGGLCVEKGTEEEWVSQSFSLSSQRFIVVINSVRYFKQLDKHPLFSVLFEI